MTSPRSRVAQSLLAFGDCAGAETFEEMDEYAQTAERLGFDVQIDAFDADPFADDG